MNARHIWLNGEIVEAVHATVPFLTAGLHYGAAVFEGIRCYDTGRGPAALRLTDHLERLLASARVLGFHDLPYTVADLAEATRRTIRANGFASCYIRPVVYLAGGGWNLDVDAGRPDAGIAVWEWTDYLGRAARAAGVRAHVSSFTRHHPNASMTQAKIAGNYVNSILAKTESVRLGFDEAIMLDPAGCVAECTGENLFVVRRGHLVTPPATGVLAGFTREMLIALAADAGYPVIERALTRDQLYLADEVFVCGTAAEVVGIREIDFRAIGAGGTGPVTRRLQDAFEAVVGWRHPRSDAWLEPVS